MFSRKKKQVLSTSVQGLNRSDGGNVATQAGLGPYRDTRDMARSEMDIRSQAQVVRPKELLVKSKKGNHNTNHNERILHSYKHSNDGLLRKDIQKDAYTGKLLSTSKQSTHSDELQSSRQVNVISLILFTLGFVASQ